MRYVSPRGKNAFARSLRILKTDRKALTYIGAIVVFSRIARAALPVVSGKITDRIAASVTQSVSEGSILPLCALMAALVLIGYGADALTGLKSMHIAQKTVSYLRSALHGKLNTLPLKYVDSHPAGDLLSRMTEDIESLGDCTENILPNLLGQSVQLAAVFVMMFLTDARLTLIYLVVVPLGVWSSTFVFGRSVQLFRKRKKIFGKMNALITDAYANHTVLRAYHCENVMTEAFDECNRTFYDSHVHASTFTGLILPVSIMVSNLAYILVCVVGGILLIGGDLSIGEFQAFLFYGNMVLAPLTAISSDINGIQDARAAAERVYEFLDEPGETDEPKNPHAELSDVRGDISFSHVRFGYTEDRLLMKDVNFAAAPGSTVAIVGKTGAGKSTLMNLLMRFYDPESGTITLDGKNIAAVGRGELRRKMGIVLQDSHLFEGTVAENIAYGRPDATMEEIRKAAGLAHCDTVIDKLRDGYQTVISDENTGLSSGEKQLICIARTILYDPPVLIMDEATSQVDTRTELLISEATEKLMENRTCFIIAHRLFTIRNADLILCMKDGDIVELGTHRELMQKNGYYAELYRNAAAVGEEEVASGLQPETVRTSA